MRVMALLLLATVPVGGPVALAGEAPPVVFGTPEDVVLVWATRAGLVLMTLSIALTLLVLLTRRQRLMEPQSRWMLFFGLCVFPIPVALLSGGVGMEESKAVAFCSSCHQPMGPFVADMLAPGSENLAAVHYKNWLIQRDHCWTCHSDYGIAGTARAKLMGLNHIARVTFGAWEPPIKLSSAYRWTICLGCHSNSARFKAPRGDASAHEGIVQAVLRGQAGCTDCHAAAHPPREQRSSR
jgi:nitrate/TMAO reductase-like tetraheme cytochrome c subunit